eukprot:COSAG04_NODE_2349_length_4288_cov_3.995942_9_plen_39_part_01
MRGGRWGLHLDVVQRQHLLRRVHADLLRLGLPIDAAVLD